jgi:hypothetical protein
VIGVGTVHVTGSRSFICQASSCRHTYRIRPGRRIVARGAPWTGWKLSRWGGACKGSALTCSLRLRRAARLSVTFVPPGDRLNAYPLGTAVRLDGAWRLTVNSAVLDADDQVEAVADQHGHRLNPPPPAGTQYTLVNVSLTYIGSGSSNVSSYVEYWLGAEGAGSKQYRLSCTPPPLDLATVLDSTYSAQTVTGNLCFDIASNDASTLLLFGTATTPADSFKTVYFALRPDA